MCFPELMGPLALTLGAAPCNGRIAPPRREQGHSQMVKRTTLRSSTGTKLYAVRNASGQFKDIQTYARAHAADIRRTSKAELAAKVKTKSKAKKKKAKARKKAPAKKK
jgi:hypothetical protein